MRRLPPRSTRTYTRFPYTSPFRSRGNRCSLGDERGRETAATGAAHRHAGLDLPEGSAYSVMNRRPASTPKKRGGPYCEFAHSPPTTCEPILYRLSVRLRPIARTKKRSSITARVIDAFTSVQIGRDN